MCNFVCVCVFVVVDLNRYVAHFLTTPCSNHDCQADKHIIELPLMHSPQSPLPPLLLPTPALSVLHFLTTPYKNILLPLLVVSSFSIPPSSLYLFL